MYEQFYGLQDKPFSLTPNPRFVFYSQRYHEAEGQLIYGIDNREGFMLVTGQPGTGKTTLCRDLIEKLDRERSQSALIVDPSLSATEVLAALLTEFGVVVPEGGTRRDLLDRLNQFLLAQLALGKRCVAIFDEAQHLSTEVLEQVRVLTNLESEQEKLIQIILVGQPELLDKIRTPQMAQLDQRVSIRCTLIDLDEQETNRYIHHRLDVAGAGGQVRFSPRAVKAIFQGSHGVPRLINLICDRALLAGFAAQTREIQPSHVVKAIAALRGEDAEANANTMAKQAAGRRVLLVGGIAVVALLAVAAGGVTLWPRRAEAPDDALYTRATTAASASEAEQDLKTFIAQYPASRHFGEALLRLARLELSRGDRTAAVQHLAQLAQHEQSGTLHSTALVLSAQALLDNGDTTAACRSVTPELTAAVAADSNLASRLTAVSSACAGTTTSATPVVGADSVSPVRDSVSTKGPAAANKKSASPAPTRAPAATATKAQKDTAVAAKKTSTPPRTAPDTTP